MCNIVIFSMIQCIFTVQNMNLMKNVYLMAVLALIAFLACSNRDESLENNFLASDKPEVVLYNLDDNKNLVPQDTLFRGTLVQTKPSSYIKIEKQKYIPVVLEDETLFVSSENLSLSREESVLEKYVFTRTPASVIDDPETSHITTLADKGDSLVITGYDSLCVNGRVNRYKVKKGDKEGYIYSKYTVLTREESLKRYMPEKYDAIHRGVKNSFRGGEAIGCDFFPYEKPKFENNKMPRACYSLYLNISPAVIGNIEEFIRLAKNTKINTFVIDIKDCECPGYKAEAMEKYSPTNYKWAGADKERMYRNAVKRLHEEGFYVVGRITCFKDTYFVKDHPEVAITEKATGQPFYHNKAYWPSAYDRKVWQFNVELAKEAVRKFGFNEINFDYVRFPDRMTKVEDIIDYHNRYNESKVQAIQRFVQYACDEIHAEGAYVSIDVFGESANPGYTTAYGQYWPALSNIADVMCGMPYPDHFADHYYGISKPWNNPYAIMKAWGSRVQDRQAATPSPAIVRTWVQAYHVMRHVDRNGIDYNAENIAKEIRGLYDAGLTGGYTTWLSSSNINKYRQQQGAFKVDYLKEYETGQTSAVVDAPVEE